MKRVDLGGLWWLMEFDVGEGEREGAFSPGYRPRPDRSLPATVPGVVHLDLMRSGVIPDPFVGKNELAVQWVEEREWWYRTEFAVPDEILRCALVDLVFYGLDTVASVWLNGEKLGETDNMFRTYRFPVGNLLSPAQNTLAVRFAPATLTAEAKMREGGPLWSVFYSARPYIRKAQYSFGWDWGPRLPTCGIWRPVLLEGYDAVAVRHLWAYLRELSSDGSAEVVAEATLFAAAPVTVSLSFRLESEEGEREENKLETNLTPGLQHLSCVLTVPAPRLWYPAGVGDPNLYRLSVEVDSEGKGIEESSVMTGLRTVELLQEPDDEGASFLFRINGAPVFCKGANWIPADSFLPRATEGVYRRLLVLARDAHMNMLRVWGGGIYENDAFYSHCDRLGIMVWQDFMFACAEYPEDETFLQEVRSEAEETVLRLRHHPSIMLWCGNNENDWGFHAGWFGRRERFFGLKIYSAVLPEVCRQLDPSRPYWQSSPFGGADPNSMSEGDRHSWDVWSAWRHPSGYLADTGRFISEFGFQSAPAIETVRSFAEEKDLYPNSSVMEHHNKQGEGTERLFRFLSAFYRVPEKLDDWIRMTQVVQGEALRTGILHWRRRKFRTAGALFWQLNDCWPVVSWSVIDYFGRPKASYFITKRSFAPVTISLVRTGDNVAVWLVNDLTRVITGRLSVSLQNMWGEVVGQSETVVAVGSNRSEQVATFPLPSGIDEASHLVFGSFTLEGEREPATYDILFFAPPKHLALPPHPVVVEAVKSFGDRAEITVRAIAAAKSVILEVDGDPDALWTDNAFDMVAGQVKHIGVSLSRPISGGDLARRLRLWSAGSGEVRR